MGLSFRKSFRLGKGLSINVSKRGLGVSAGVKGARLGLGSGRKARIRGGFGPFHYYKTIEDGSPKSKSARTKPGKKKGKGCGCFLIAVLLSIFVIGMLDDTTGARPDSSSIPHDPQSASPESQKWDAVNVVQTDRLVSDTPKTKAEEPTNALVITKEILRIGKDFYVGDESSHSLQGLKDSQEWPIPENAEFIKVPFLQAAEIEITYEELWLKPNGFLFDSCYFEIIDEHGVWHKVNMGTTKSFEISSTGAIALFSPWLYVPFGDGGKTTMRLVLKLENGQKLSKEWIIHVGRNPKVYESEW